MTGNDDDGYYQRKSILRYVALITVQNYQQCSLCAFLYALKDIFERVMFARVYVSVKFYERADTLQNCAISHSMLKTLKCLL